MRVERESVLLVALAGSHAHGTARDGSDVDVRGVATASLTERLSLFHSPEQHEGAIPSSIEAPVLQSLRAHPTAARSLSTKVECVIFDVAKFLGLCVAANPNTLEILFVDERDWLLAGDGWRLLHGERHRFLTRKVEQTFSGYALAQLRKIETHRGWLLHPPAEKPSRAAFGLPEGTSAAALEAETRYRAAMKQWEAYRAWQAHRNPDRAALERTHGYDTKHAMHLVRLLRMGLEALERGDLSVRRPDAGELVAIRDGALPFDELRAMAEDLRARIRRAAAATTLPEDIDRAWVDEVAFRLMTG